MNATTTRYLFFLLGSLHHFYCIVSTRFCLLFFRLLRYRTFPFRCCGRSISSSLHTIPVEVPRIVWLSGMVSARWTWNGRRGFWKMEFFAPDTPSPILWGFRFYVCNVPRMLTAISHVAKSLLTERQKLKVRVVGDVRELLEEWKPRIWFQILHCKLHG